MGKGKVDEVVPLSRLNIAFLSPVEQVTKIQTIVNVRTAKALGIEVPTSLLLRVDEVIE